MKSKTERYVALIEHEPGTLYGVRFPDLPGCYSSGDSAGDAAENAMEAVRLWAEDAIDAGETLPEARALDAVLADADTREAIAAGAIPVLVPLYLASGRTTRANISIDTGELAMIDDAAKSYGLTRSGFLVEAAREKIGMHLAG